ncbi:non-homologous end-joining factor 1 isoform X3 [Thalassophryne amazonica]|uniref:non-homologous end-joining factor 1 isoform X3 n=1 Tax=Thalassophryne amazonica TaxID=390379 RepID=UPI0014713C4F|nr:non-homologous end-joining factor 1 isoform X3 [Thalassophryne amazonica]
MELSSAPVQDLLEHPWVTVSISGCQVLSKSWFGETAYHVLLSDLHCVWEERMEAAAIQTRAQELNRRLRAPVEAFFSHLCEVVRPCLMGGVEQVSGATQVSLTQQDDGNIRLRLKSELAGLPFYWEFRCTTAPTTVACAHLVRPLLVMSRLLQREVEQLGALLVKKDAEIQDFQENGATLSRERLQTDPYDDQTFKEDFMLKVCVLVAVVTHARHLQPENKLSCCLLGKWQTHCFKRSSSQRPHEDAAHFTVFTRSPQKLIFMD